MAVRTEDQVTYTPALIDRYLREWDADYSLPASIELVRSATRPGEPRLLARLRRCYRGRGPVEQVIGAADICQAWQRLAPGSLERRVVALRAEQLTLQQIARVLRTRTSVVVAAYHAAVERMACWLNGCGEPGAA